MIAHSSPACPYCSQAAELSRGTEIYPHRPDLAILKFWLCHACDAYVGCHKGGTQPLGRLANSELRRAKNKAHAAFDPMWKNGEMTRKQAYKWLADRLDLAPKRTHIGEFDVEMCLRVVAVCTNAMEGRRK